MISNNLYPMCKKLMACLKHVQICRRQDTRKTKMFTFHSIHTTIISKHPVPCAKHFKTRIRVFDLNNVLEKTNGKYDHQARDTRNSPGSNKRSRKRLEKPHPTLEKNDDRLVKITNRAKLTKPFHQKKSTKMRK